MRVLLSAHCAIGIDEFWVCHAEYSHALAEYAFVDPNTKGRQTLFQANFDKPLLEFICNHDAILRLKISKGYYRLDYTKSSSMTYSEK